jgi:K+-transporting ATPase c subunit
MSSHLRANLWLLILTVLVCCVLYPLVLWGFGQTLFPAQADGSLVLGPDGKPRGSSLIGQGFVGDDYFQPRPSATSPTPYNAAASGGSNLAASNPKLRERVARQLGPIVRYAGGPKKGERVGPDVEKWAGIPFNLGTENPEIQAAFFDAWLQAHPDVELEKVPADMVMASGSGLDPHITLRNAQYQTRRVAETRAKKTIEALEKKEGRPLTPARREEIEGRTRRHVEELVDKAAFDLMGGTGIAGTEKLVNVLELNLALDK